MLSIENTVVLVVDIQERLRPALYQSDDFVAHCVQFLTGANDLKLPIIVTEQYPKGLGKTLPEIQAQTMTASVFENVILVGCETHICMLQTVLDLRQIGVNVYIPQECTTSRTLANHMNGLQQIQAAGAIVSNIESVLFQLLQDAKHPVFKPLSKLIQ